VFRRYVVVVACACSGPLHVQAPASDHLTGLRIEGNQAIATGALEPALALHEAITDGGAIDPYVLTSDAERIRVAYVKLGFFAVRVTPRIEHTGGGQTVVFAVVEGRRATAQIEIAGLPPEVPLAKARALIALADGAPFDYDASAAAKQPLAALVENAGYAHVVVSHRAMPDPDAAIARVRYEVVPGVRCKFGEIRGGELLAPALRAAVFARVQFATGDRYAVSVMEEAQAEIYALGRFSTVQIVPERANSAAVIDVTLELSEANRHEVHAGFGVGYEPASYELRARGGGSLVPAAQPLLTLASELRVALTVPHDGELGVPQFHDVQPKVRGLVSLQRLDLWRPWLRGEVEVGADYQTVEAYTWTGEYARLGLGSPLGPRWLQLHLGWQIEHLSFDDIASVLANEHARLRLDASQNLGEYQAALVADLRDNPIEPHRGAYVDLRAAVGTPLALGDSTFLQLTPELRGYLTLARITIAARARVGAIFGAVPVTERYYSGGTSGQRGFSERQLSPKLPEACPTQTDCRVVVGGAGLIETGVELRRQLGSLWKMPVGLNLFLDGGDVADTPQALEPANLYWAVGTGIWGKLVGDLKIRIDLGYRLNRTTAPDPLATGGGIDNVSLHVGVGESY
jgi:outer membrane protein assembly factor BamA